MAKRTILQLVQLMSEAIQGDDISSLGETTEAVELANILALTYEEVLTRPISGWEFMRNKVRQLDDREVGDTQLNRLKIPEDVYTVQEVKYISGDGSFDKPVSLIYVHPVDFMNMIQGRNPADANVTAYTNDDGVAMNIFTDRTPRYWTSFDEEYIYFDAYDSDRSAGVVYTDSVIIATVMPVTDFTDPAATLSVPERMEKLIMYQAIATASIQLRQIQDLKAEQLSNRQFIRLTTAEPKTVKDKRELDYGR